MPGKKIGEENIRKLQRTGEERGSYMLTLPKSMVKNLGWREHQKVIVVQTGETLVIKDWEK